MSIWVRIGLVALVVVAGSAAAFFGLTSVRSPITKQIATQSAQSAFGHDKLNLLLLGYQDDEMTTDTIVLAHLDVEQQTATLVSIPRDTWVPVPGHGSQKINAAFAFGGAGVTAGVVSKLMNGIPIDATIALQPQGAAQIVDALGGLNVPVDEDMDYDDNYGQLHIHLKKGEQYLTGSQVVGYIRFRHDVSSDFGRMHRQQQVLRLMVDQLSRPQAWVKLPHILQLARKDVKTALTDRQLLALLQIYRNVPEDRFRTFTLPSTEGWVGDASVVFVDPRWAGLIGSILFTRTTPPQDEVVVVNATGVTDFDKTVVGALRGGGWNVPSFVDQPPHKTSITIGSSPAAQTLAQLFATQRRAGTKTSLVIGADLAPSTP